MFHATYGALRIQLHHFSYDDCENMCSSFYYHHQIGSMTHLPLIRVRSWNNGMYCMSFYFLITAFLLWRPEHCRQTGSTHWPLGDLNDIFRFVIFNVILEVDGQGISYEIILRWMSQDLSDDKSTLIQAMAWCRQATSHYLSQCWPRSMSPYGVTRPQWVNII